MAPLSQKTFAEFGNKTTAAIATTASPAGKSIAVLPLESLSDDKENAFFADGLHDDILTTLAKISDLKVISRTSVSQYQGRGVALNCVRLVVPSAWTIFSKEVSAASAIASSSTSS